MKTIDVDEATTTLSDYARRGLREVVVVTRNGKPVLALTPVHGDWESVVVATNPAFMEIVQRSRASLGAGKGISTGDMRRRLGPKPKVSERVSRRSKVPSRRSQR